MLTVDSYRPDTYRGRRVLITGASGFIGRWVARALTAARAALWLVSRNTTGLAEVCNAYDIQGHSVPADLSKPGTFLRLYREVQPDVIFNLAGYGVDPEERDPVLAARLNSDLVREIAESVSSSNHSDWPGLRLIHAGTAAEYGPVVGRLTENSSTAPMSLYGRTKLEGTCALLELRERSKIPAICARLFTVYGPGEHAGRLLPSLLARARMGGTLALTQGDQQRDFTYVADVAEGFLRLGALTHPACGVVNLATGVPTSVRTFAECAAELLGLEREQLQFGVLPYAQEDVRQGPVDMDLLRQLVRWAPPCSIREGIRQTIEFEARLSRVGK